MRLASALESLRQGKPATFKASGNSMSGLIKSGSVVTVYPVAPECVAVGDIVLATVKGRHYLHLVKALKKGMAQIGNNHGHINGWTPLKNIHGKYRP